MWKRGGRSSALDRAEALLAAAKRESVPGSSAKTAGADGRSVINRSAPTSAHTLFLDESDLSSVSSGRHLGPDVAGSAAATEIQRKKGDSAKDGKPQSSLARGGSRFLKKASSPVPNSYQSPFKAPDPRNISSSMQDFKAAAVSRLAQNENQSFKQDGQEPNPPVNHISDLGIIQPETALKASVPQSVQSSSDRSLKGRRFLKNHTNMKSTNNAAAKSLQGPDAVVPSVGLETKSARSVRTVSLDSDEEDMRKLLGDFSDSVNSVVTPGRASAISAADKKLSKSRQALNSAPPAVVPPSSSTSAPPHHSSRCSSPFRFPGKAQVRFSPSVPSPTPSPPHRSPSPPGRDGDVSLQDSSSSLSGCSKVLSLEELFPVGLGSDDPHSEMSVAFSEDFKINVLTLDELAPAKVTFSEETPYQESGTRKGALASLSREQLLRLVEKEEELQQEEEDVHNYQSDFESESRTEPDASASQVSEHLQGQEDEEEVVSEHREEASHSHVSHGRTEDDYSSSFSDTGCSYNSSVSDHSQPHNRCRESRSSNSSVSYCSFSQQTRRRHSSTRKLFKEAAVQTQADTLPDSRLKGGTSLGSAIGMSSTPVITHMLSAEMVEALSTLNPAASALHELLKQRLALTRQFIQSSRQLRSSLLRSLEPPNYRYTTLEDTREYIRKHRPATLTMEKAMEEVMQEMRDGV